MPAIDYGKNKTYVYYTLRIWNEIEWKYDEYSGKLEECQINKTVTDYWHKPPMSYLKIRDYTRFKM